MEPRAEILQHGRTSVIVDIIQEIRIKQWTKNLLVFASALFAGQVLNPSVFLNALLAFLAFSLMASTIYVINDIFDVEKDKLHPDKCNRPLAREAISIPMAIVLAVVTFCFSVTLGLMVNTALTVILLIYFVTNLLYSLQLKHVVIIDVMLIALGFVLRAVAGALAVNGLLTSWFILCTMGLSLFLALGKRRHELKIFNENSSSRRKVLDFYSIAMLDQLMTVVTAVLIMFYSMYAASEGQRMMFTIPIVLYGIFRYYYLIHMKNAGGKPEDILVSDRHILGTVLIFCIAIAFIKAFN
ncbi:decaprenyl-phosphate phosphoribosyltransferase [Paenibacillus humicus]|uniref:decaprenyl-phosphate phosphoribosyltransferase n=1 Tax=Paenibacillus humicus TaxID=412861 RepID=UPI000FDA6501|nr:decaprenyl-phosphate phosphoribosyltransferase [Paenibacillus humicus]